MQLNILYEDNHVIAVRKPHGLLVQGDHTGDPSLINEVRYFLKQRDDKPGNVFLGLVHRLDRPVGGVVIFGKTSKGAARLSEQFRARSVEKVYWAVVEGISADGSDGGVVTHWLRKNEDQNRSEAFDHEVPDSQFSETTWSIVNRFNDGRALVEVRPKTGRSHQIRVAMQSLGTPIVGDVKYGASSPILLPSGSTALALMARSLTIDHVVTKERFTITADPELDIFQS